MSESFPVHVTRGLEHIRQFTGRIWYIDDVLGSDTNNGLYATSPFKTIGKGILSMADGDALQLRSGTYTEASLDISNDGVEVWCEPGTFITVAAGTSLVLSGDYICVHGPLRASPAAGEVGIHVTGDGGVLRDTTVFGTASAKGFHLEATGTELWECRSTGMASGGINFDIDGDQSRLFNCATTGDTDSWGFYVNGGANSRGILAECTSVGNGAGGFYAGPNTEYYTFRQCSSGAGDGKVTMGPTTNVWPFFTYDNSVYKVATFTGAGPGAINLFEVTGAVLISDLHAHVSTVLSADVGLLHYGLWDGTASVPITKTPGASGASLPVGSSLIRTGTSASVVTVLSAAAGAIAEGAGKEPFADFVAQKKTGASTYIRLNHSGVATSGAIQCHCTWVPLSDDGFVEPA
jgi:hypothetical protein